MIVGCGCAHSNRMKIHIWVKWPSEKSEQKNQKKKKKKEFQIWIKHVLKSSLNLPITMKKKFQIMSTEQHKRREKKLWLHSSPSHTVALGAHIMSSNDFKFYVTNELHVDSKFDSLTVFSFFFFLRNLIINSLNFFLVSVKLYNVMKSDCSGKQLWSNYG